MTAKVHSDYLHQVYRVKLFVKLVNRVAAAIKKYRKSHPFEAIAFTGTSGAALAYPVSAKLGIPLLCIRKGNNNHFKNPVEGYVGAKSYAIIDDFIDTGDTLRKILKEMKKESSYWDHGPAKPTVIFLYTSYGPKGKTWNSIPVVRV